MIVLHDVRRREGEGEGGRTERRGMSYIKMKEARDTDLNVGWRWGGDDS